MSFSVSTSPWPITSRHGSQEMVISMDRVHQVVPDSFRLLQSGRWELWLAYPPLGVGAVHPPMPWARHISHCPPRTGSGQWLCRPTCLVSSLAFKTETLSPIILGCPIDDLSVFKALPSSMAVIVAPLSLSSGWNTEKAKSNIWTIGLWGFCWGFVICAKDLGLIDKRNDVSSMPVLPWKMDLGLYIYERFPLIGYGRQMNFSLYAI